MNAIRLTILFFTLINGTPHNCYSQEKPWHGFTKDYITSSLDSVKQYFYYYESIGDENKPLVVSLHQWSADYSIYRNSLAHETKAKNWNYIHPDFRGPNKHVKACGSEYVIADIDESIDWAIKNLPVDTTRIFIVGASGGGYAALCHFMKSRHKIKEYSVWVPISDLKRWYFESKSRNSKYATDIIRCTCEDCNEINLELAVERSPLYWETPVNKLDDCKLKIYAGICGNCVEENIANAKAYIQAGADVIVSILPYYYPLTSVQMFGYFKTLAERINFPTMVYNIPSTTKMSIPIEVVEELSKVKHICGFKDSERDQARMEQCVNLFKDRENFSYFPGYAAISAKALKLGADGLVPSTGNFVPGMFRDMYEYSMAEHWQEVERLQKETDIVAKIYQSGRTLGNSLQALKVMMSVQGLCKPYALPPLTDLATAEQEKIVTETEIIIEKYQIKSAVTD